MVTTTIDKPRKRNRTDDLNDHITEINERQRLDSWTAFVDELQVPSELYPAILTLRHELVRAAPVRAMNEQEVRALYALIAGLLETNAALREHAQEVAKLVSNWGDAFTALRGVGRRIENFANFRRDEEE